LIRCFPAADEHAMSNAAEFANRSGEGIVHKNGGSLRRDLQLDLGSDFRKASRGSFSMTTCKTIFLCGSTTTFCRKSVYPD